MEIVIGKEGEERCCTICNIDIDIFQFIFISVGWLVSHEIWRLVHPETDTEVDVESLVNFVLTDQNGLGGASIGIGYVSDNYPHTPHVKLILFPRR